MKKEIEFRLASRDEFFTWKVHTDPGSNTSKKIKFRNLGMFFWILNSQDDLELYTINNETSMKDLFDQIDNKRVYLPKQL